MSWLSSFLHPEKGYKDAQKKLEKYFQQAQQYQQPYLQHGEEAYGNLSGAMDALLNPEELYSKWASSYEESPAAKFAEELAQTHGLDAASAMGLLGSSPALQAIQGGKAQIGLEERQNYLNDLMQKYMAGAGIGQNIYGIGANAAGQLGQNAMNMGQNAAQLKYGEKSSKGNLFGNLLGTGAGVVGGALGGPIGGALGAGLAQKMGWSPKGSYMPYGSSNQSPMPNYVYGS